MTPDRSLFGPELPRIDETVKLTVNRLTQGLDTLGRRGQAIVWGINLASGELPLAYFDVGRLHMERRNVSQDGHAHSIIELDFHDYDEDRHVPYGLVYQEKRIIPAGNNVVFWSRWYGEVDQRQAQKGPVEAQFRIGKIGQGVRPVGTAYFNLGSYPIEQLFEEQIAHHAPKDVIALSAVARYQQEDQFLVAVAPGTREVLYSDFWEPVRQAGYDFNAIHNFPPDPRYFPAGGYLLPIGHSPRLTI